MNLLVALLVTGAAASTMTTVTQLRVREEASLKSQFGLLNLKTESKNYFHNVRSWTFAKTNSGVGSCNTSLQCVSNGTSCSSFMLTAGVINCVYDESGAVVYDDRIASNGFDLNGRPCNTYSNSDPEGKCRFRLQITWKPVCSNSALCSGRMVQVTVTPTLNPGSTTIPINTVNYGFTTYLW